MFVGVVPVGSCGMIIWDVILKVEPLSRKNLQQHVIGITFGRDVQPMQVHVRGIEVMRHVHGVHSGWVWRQIVDESQSKGVSRTHAKGRTVWEGGNERIELETTMAFRPTGLDLCVNITLNGAPYWEKVRTRQWPQREWAV